MIICGIDQSLTNTGIVIVQDNSIIHHGIIPSNTGVGDMHERVHQISSEIIEIVIKYKPDLVRIEGLSMGSRAGMLGDLGGLQHVIISKIKYGLGIQVDVIPPKTLKKLCSGNGNAGKWDMFDALPSEVQQLFISNYKFSKRDAKTISGNGFDITDAYHLATVKLPDTF